MRRVIVVLSLACLAAGLGGVRGFAARAAADDDAYLDSDFDGVWVGSMAVKTGDGVRQQPLLLNLDASGGDLRGVALMADTLVGEPSAVSAFSIQDGTVKGRKLKFSLPATDDAAARLLHPLARTAQAHHLVLRLRRGALKGKLASDVAGISGKARVELLPVDADSPLQQLWIGELTPTGGRAGATQPVAIFVRTDRASPGGAGFVGDAFGTVKSASTTGDDVSITLATPAGDIRLALSASRKGPMTGNASGAARGALSAGPGGVGGAIKVRKALPGELPSGTSTSVTLKARNLVPGTLVHVDDPDVYAGVPEILKPRLARVRIVVPAGMAAGTLLHLRLLPPDGVPVDLKGSLRSGPPGIPSWSGDLEPIILSRCAVAGCHVTPDLDDPMYGDGGEAPAGLEMDNGKAYARLVNVPSTEMPELMRIAPGNPDDSYLIRKIRGVGITGERMPRGGPYLSDEVIDMFVAWVLAGAPKN